MLKKLIIVLPFILILFVSSYGSINKVFADDFYDRNESEFDVFPDGEYKDLIKDYNYKENTFDCGWIDFYCKVNGQMFTMVLGLVKASYSNSDTVIVKPTEILSNPIFYLYKLSLDRLSVWMLAIFLMWHIMKIVAMRFAEAEDGMVAMNEKIIKVVTLSILLGIYNPLFTLILKLQQYAVAGVMENVVDTEDIAVTIFINGGAYGFLMALGIAVIMVIFNIAFMYRFVLFGLLYIVGVIAIPTGMNDEYNFFGLWLRLLISNGVTLFLQALVFTLGVKALFVQEAFNGGTSLITGIAFFVLALAIPSLLGQLGSSSGTGKAVGSVVRVAGRSMR